MPVDSACGICHAYIALFRGTLNLLPMRRAMPEPITTLGAGAITAYLAKDGLQKILGPTADYLGDQLKNWTQKQHENLRNIFKNAEVKLGDRLNAEGAVPPKVLKTIMNDGSFNDDAIAIEYFGGVLASSKAELGRDDRGARMAKLIDSLSSYQLRAHYILYSTIRKLFSGRNYHFNMNDRVKMTIFIPYDKFFSAMDFSDGEMQIVSPLIQHIFFGLGNEALIENDFVYGSKNNILKWYKDAVCDGIICAPSTLGAELYLWAFGKKDKLLCYILDSEFVPEIDQVPCCISDAVAVHAQ